MTTHAKPFNWRTDVFHPDCRRDWARITDNRSYRGPHNIVAEDEPPRFLGLHWAVFPFGVLLVIALEVMGRLG